MMKKILLPTDFSENSWNAIKYALQLFKDEQCTFTLLNTYSPIIYDPEYVMIETMRTQVFDSVRQVSQDELKKLEDRILNEFKNPNHIFARLSAYNILALEVRELQEAENIDCVVMGTKGASGVKEVLIGSNTVHVFKNAKCPILAIPDNFSFETPHEILFPSDYEINYQKKHLQPLVDIASKYHSRINIMHITYGDELTEKQEVNKQKLETYFKEIAYLFHSVHNQNITEAIENFQLQSRINLLVMIKNKHTFFENLFLKKTINQIGFHLNIPFMVIPE